MICSNFIVGFVGAGMFAFVSTCVIHAHLFESNEKIYNRFEFSNELATHDALAPMNNWTSWFWLIYLLVYFRHSRMGPRFFFSILWFAITLFPGLQSVVLQHSLKLRYFHTNCKLSWSEVWSAAILHYFLDFHDSGANQTWVESWTIIVAIQMLTMA